MDRILLASPSTQTHLIALSKPFQRLIVEFTLALALLLVPTTLLYLAIYSLVSNRHFSHAVFTFFSVAGLWPARGLLQCDVARFEAYSCLQVRSSAAFNDYVR
jgi:hypothetical protein